MERFTRWAVFILAPIIAVIALSKTLPNAVAFNAFFAPVLAIADYLPAGVATLAFVATVGALGLLLLVILRGVFGYNAAKRDKK